MRPAWRAMAIKNPLPKLSKVLLKEALLLKKQPKFELNNLLCKKNLLPRKISFLFILWFFFCSSRLFLLSSPFRILYSEILALIFPLFYHKFFFEIRRLRKKTWLLLFFLCSARFFLVLIFFQFFRG